MTERITRPVLRDDERLPPARFALGGQTWREIAHLLANLPPGEDHVHQVVFILLSLLGLLLPVGDFFAKASAA